MNWGVKTLKEIWNYVFVRESNHKGIYSEHACWEGQEIHSLCITCKKASAHRYLFYSKPACLTEKDLKIKGR